MGRMLRTLGFCAGMAILVGCTKNESDTVTGSAPEPILDSTQVVIVGARLASAPLAPFQSTGDIWRSTWSDDDKLYVSWGDGAGPGQSYINPVFGTDAGVAALEGTIPNFTNVSSPFECVRSLYVPDGVGWNGNMADDDKPSSMLFCEGRLYFAGHTPWPDPDYGYVAYSDDHGLSWTEVPNSPWTKASESVFRNLMFVNMGKNYELNEDGYVYAFGIGTDYDWFQQTVYLCRVPISAVSDYNEYRYYTGIDTAGLPIWSAEEAQATPVEDLHFMGLSSAMYHPGSQHYILICNTSGLYVAQQPWGPWEWVRFEASEYDSLWEGGYMPGIIPKDAGTDYFYFTLAGQDSVIGYFCHIGKVELDLAEIIP